MEKDRGRHATRITQVKFSGQWEVQKLSRLFTSHKWRGQMPIMRVYDDVVVSALPLVELWATSGPVADGVIYPDGCMDLVTDGDVVVVAGADSRARRFVLTGPERPMWGARFHPGLLPMLLDIPAHEVTDRVVPLTDISSLKVNPSNLRNMSLLCKVLPVERCDLAPIRVATTLWQGNTVETVAQMAGWSTRQLRRLSADWFGYGPKHLQRVLRLRRAEGLMDQGFDRARVAAECGYADASHLWRDRKDLAVVAP